MLYALLTLCLIYGSYAQVPMLGSCPNLRTVPNFDLSRYLGRWYEAQKYFAFYESGGKCITADYSPRTNGAMNVLHSEILTRTGEPSSVDGYARIPNPNEPAKLKVSISSSLFGTERDYWVLGTDYKNYAVIYSCKNVKSFHLKYAWILTRERNPPQSVIDAALRVAADNDIDEAFFMRTDQKNCAN